MNTRTYLATFLIAASIVMATVSIASVASADKDDASKGVEKADDKVHENTGPVSDQDVKFLSRF